MKILFLFSLVLFCVGCEPAYVENDKRAEFVKSCINMGHVPGECIIISNDLYPRENTIKHKLTK